MSQKRRLARKLGLYGGQAAAPLDIPRPMDPGAQAALEQDWKRENLAQELLKILTEEVVGYGEGETIETGRLVEQMEVAADAAMAAAEKLYPELPEE